MPPTTSAHLGGYAMVTPASQGLGLALAKRLLNTTRLPIVVTARESDLSGVKSRIMEGLDGIDASRVTVLKLDMTNEKSIKDGAAQVGQQFQDRRLQLMLAVPGILHPERAPKDLNHDNIINTFSVNTIGPLLLIKHFSGLLATKHDDTFEPESALPGFSVWACMSARVGSISDNSLGGWYSYVGSSRASKAALNSIVKTFDIHLQRTSKDKAVAIGLHPGTVKTQFSKEFWEGVQKKGQLFEPDYSAEKLMNVIGGLKHIQRGRVWDWKGTEINP